MIPIEDLTNVTLAIEDTDEEDLNIFGKSKHFWKIKKNLKI